MAADQNQNASMWIEDHIVVPQESNHGLGVGAESVYIIVISNHNAAQLLRVLCEFCTQCRPPHVHPASALMVQALGEVEGTDERDRQHST